MCGITGIFDVRGLDATTALDLVQRMGKRIRHRGPDDSGEWCDATAGIVLGQRRLSINDLSPAGHQPMISANGRFVIVLNGEIYNFMDLRDALELAGYPFRGHSDTEVALAAIQHYGFEAALKMFVGMFAIGLWDRESRALYLARDRVGEKPLYYSRVGNAFAFASDLDALRELPGWSPEIDRNALGLLMQHFYVPAPRTIYRDVHKLMPGNLLTLRADNYSLEPELRSYWSAADISAGRVQSSGAPDTNAAVDELDTLLRKTIRDKMISDVPLGAFLSGGIDSSTVVALMQAESMNKVKTFSIGFGEAEFNEAHEAKRVAEHLGTEHTELYVSAAQAQSVIPKLPAMYSEPFADSSQIPTYLVSELARQQVTVALSGDGGDELFGGYSRYLHAESSWQRINRLPRALRIALGGTLAMIPPARIDAIMRPLKPMLPERWRYQQFGNKIHKLAILSECDNPMSVYRALISAWMRPSQVVIGGGDIDLIDTMPASINEVSSFSERMMLMDLLTYLPDDILTKVDRASMSESLEVRVPFLDHRVIEHALRLPISLKVRDGEGKWLLKQVLYRYAPKSLLDRPKMGFGVPVGQWLRGPLRSWAEDLLDGTRLQQDGFFHATVVREKWSEHQRGKADWSALLWPILMYQAWFDHYERHPGSRSD